MAAAIAIGGCAGLRDSMSGWFGGTSEPTAAPAAARQGQTYYSAVEGLTVYAEAASSSKVVGRLALHEKVTRSRVERGYAYIEADKGALAGWVDNAQLLWRLPTSAGEATPGQGEPATAAGGDGAADGTPAAPPTPTSIPATPTVEEAATAAPLPPAAPPSPPTPRKPAPSMFDPY